MSLILGRPLYVFYLIKNYKQIYMMSSVVTIRASKRIKQCKRNPPQSESDPGNQFTKVSRQDNTTELTQSSRWTETDCFWRLNRAEEAATGKSKKGKKGKGERGRKVHLGRLRKIRKIWICSKIWNWKSQISAK